MIRVFEDLEENRKEAKWSGKNPPPIIGDRVKINFNNLGYGRVVGYFEQDGYLGVRILLEQAPAFRRRQGTPDSTPAMIFGAELTI